MSEQVFNLAQWIKEKKFYPMVRIILNLIFTLVITNQICYNTQYDVQSLLPDVNQGYIGWALQGKYVAPAIVFVMCWFITSWISIGVFKLIHWLCFRRLRRFISNGIVTKKNVDRTLAIARVFAWRYKSIHLTKNEIVEYYHRVREVLPNHELSKMYNDLVKEIDDFELNFAFIVRTMIALSIYCFILGAVSSALFWVALGVCLIVMFGCVLAKLFIKLLPDLAVRFEMIVSEYKANTLPAKRA